MFIDVTICQFLALFLFVHLFFLIAIRKKRNDIADVAWGLGFVLLALVAIIHNPNPITLVVFGLVSLWGLRLASHIYARFKVHPEEDGRYAKWRKDWGDKWRFWSWAKVFMLQGFTLLLVALPILLNARFSEGGWHWLNSLGVIVFFVFWIIEIVADRQLKSFIKNKKSPSGPRIMKEGLWKYSRHPNYFGEAGLWWGILLATWGHDYFWYGIIGPLSIFILLRFVSGVPMAEERYLGNPEFEEYKKKTPAFFPKLL